jgi:hypothetical protein
MPFHIASCATGHEPPCGGRGIADQIGLARIGDEAVLFERDVEVDDVAVADDLVRIGHAVADDMIDRAVQDIFEAILPLARRTCGKVDGDEAIDQIVDLHRRHAGEVLPVQHLEDRRQQFCPIRA